MPEPIRKQWKGFEHQAPNPKIEVFTRGIKGEADITFTADIRAGVFGGLSGYTFSESVEDLEGSFSFSVVNDEAGADGNIQREKCYFVYRRVCRFPGRENTGSG